MTTLTRDQIFKNLTGKISDGDYSRVERDFPIAAGCPTCDGRGRYVLDGKTYDCDCQIQKLLQRHYFAANIGREYHDIGLDHFTGDDADLVVPKVRDYIEKFNDSFHYGLGITFDGPVGTGKTLAMTHVLKELVKQGRRVYFITFDEMINIWSAAWHDEESKHMLHQKLKTVEVLGIDEVKTDNRNNGGFLSSGLETIIRHRTSNLLPTLLTTNMSKEQEEDVFTKTYSLLSARNDRISTKGSDYRREIGWVNKTLRELGERRPIC